MKRFFSLSSAIVFLVIFILACDRTSREYGAAKSAVSGDPSYGNVQTQVSLVPAAAHVESVMPKGALDGAAIYNRVCAACHQVTGQGIPGAFPPLDGSKYVTSDNVSRLAAIMVYGLQGPIKVNGTEYNSMMAPQGSVLKDEELAAVATYVRSTWSNKSGAVQAAVFAEVRKKYGSRGPFTIAELGEEQ